MKRPESGWTALVLLLSGLKHIAQRRLEYLAIVVLGKLRDETVLLRALEAGNFIEATEDSPFFQLGEHKYGKPILDRVINVDTDIQDGVICALLSMDSTIRSNPSCLISIRAN